MADETWFKLGPADEIGPGKTKDFLVDHDDGEVGVLVANCNGEFFAIEDRCTHDDGPLASGRLLHCQVECPRHGAKFDMKTGRATQLPAFTPVASFPVRIEDGQLEVRIGAKPQAMFEDPRGQFRIGF